jgi:LPXTG-motif cell wall-anchored protein
MPDAFGDVGEGAIVSDPDHGQPSQRAVDDTYCGRNIGWDGSTTTPYADFLAVRAKAYALGLLSDPDKAASNRALADNTSGGKPDADVFGTTKPITFPDGSGRDIAFSYDAAATYCDAPADTHPSLQLSYTQGGVSHPVGAPIDPCTQDGFRTLHLKNAGALFADYDGTPSAKWQGYTDGNNAVHYGRVTAVVHVPDVTGGITLHVTDASAHSSFGTGVGNYPNSEVGPGQLPGLTQDWDADGNMFFKPVDGTRPGFQWSSDNNYNDGSPNEFTRDGRTFSMEYGWPTDRTNASGLVGQNYDKVPSNNGNGNDFALDNISVTDLTPKPAAPAPQPVKHEAQAPVKLAQTGVNAMPLAVLSAMLLTAGWMLAAARRRRA